MLIKQLDQKNTLALIGEYLAYHNLLRRNIDDKFGKITKIPIQFDTDLGTFGIIRNQLAHEVWEIIHNDIISINTGKPNWIIKHEELKEHIKNLLKLRNKILEYGQ